MKAIHKNRKSGNRKAFSFPICRLREIGWTIPDRTYDQIRAVLPEVAATYRVIISHSRWPLRSLQGQMEQWCDRMRIGKVFTEDEIAEAIEQGEQRNSLASADRLAEILGLEYADRQRLAIRTIGAVDLDKRRRAIERNERKRERDRIRVAIKRRKRGAISREEYLAESLSRSRPWEREGISRRTWERRRVASQSPPHIESPSDTLATTGTEQPLAPRQLAAIIDLAVEIGVIEEHGPARRENRAA